MNAKEEAARKAHDNRERQRRWRENRIAAGLQLLKIWTHPEDAERVKTYAARLHKQRERQQTNA